MLLNYKSTIKACYFGYITQAIVNNLAPLLFTVFNTQFGISLEKITLLITVNFCVQLTVDFLSAKFVDKIGYRTSIVAAHFLSAGGLIGMGVLPFLFSNPFAGLITAVSIYAVGGGLLEVLVSPIVEACPSDNKAAVMSLLHSFYCWGTVGVILLTTAALYAFGKNSWQIIACVWALLPLANAFVFMRVPINTLNSGSASMTVKELFRSKLFWLFVVFMITAGASEQAMSQWASAFAEKGLGVTKAIGDLTGPCLFSVFMGFSRVFYAKAGQKIVLTKFLAGSAVLCIISYLIASLSPSAFVSLIGCSLCGLSVGILWPGVFSLAAEKMPKGGTALFAFLALAGDLGCSGGPTAVGLISGVFGDNLKTGLLFAVIFPALLIVCTVIYSKAVKQSKIIQ